MPSPKSGRRVISSLSFSVLVALLLIAAGSSNVKAQPRYLGCLLGNGSYWLVLIDSFGGMSEAVHHCLSDLNGHPFGVED